MGAAPSGWRAPPYYNLLTGVALNSVDEANPATVYANSSAVKDDLLVAGTRKRAFVRFNAAPLTQIRPVTWQISSAMGDQLLTQWMYNPNAIGTISLIVRADLVGVDWNPATLTWNNQPAGLGLPDMVHFGQYSVGGGTWTAPFTYSAQLTDTKLFGNFLTGLTPIYGMLITVQVGTTSLLNLGTLRCTGNAVTLNTPQIVVNV